MSEPACTDCHLFPIIPVSRALTPPMRSGPVPPQSAGKAGLAVDVRVRHFDAKPGNVISRVKSAVTFGLVAMPNTGKTLFGPLAARPM